MPAAEGVDVQQPDSPAQEPPCLLDREFIRPPLLGPRQSLEQFESAALSPSRVADFSARSARATALSSSTMGWPFLTVSPCLTRSS